VVVNLLNRPVYSVQENPIRILLRAWSRFPRIVSSSHNPRHSDEQSEEESLRELLMSKVSASTGLDPQGSVYKAK
jgi:hypothetical protein